jgi:exodeoxyribonuclease III
MAYKLLSWNVNGIRATAKKGFLQWLHNEAPFICALQETKASPEQLSDEIKSPPGYYSYWNAAERKGYSGVAVYTQEKPLEVITGFGKEAFDNEGRMLICVYPRFFFINLYIPNGGMGPERLAFKLSFYKELLNMLKQLKKKKKSIILCGDINTAHKEIDLARPKENENNTGFLPEERAWLDTFIKWGLVDTFRIFNKEPSHYTWWDYKTRSRERNVGWRLDYFFVDKTSVACVKDAFILHDIKGSDHCPIGLIIS